MTKNVGCYFPADLTRLLWSGTLGLRKGRPMN